MTKLQNKS